MEDGFFFRICDVGALVVFRFSIERLPYVKSVICLSNSASFLEDR